MEEAVVRNVLRAVIPIVFLGALLFFVILSALLNYHWTRFEITAERARRIKKLFFSVAGILVAIMVTTGLVYIF